VREENSWRRHVRRSRSAETILAKGDEDLPTADHIRSKKALVIERHTRAFDAHFQAVDRRFDPGWLLS
jgi:hypothetical protein